MNKVSFHILELHKIIGDMWEQICAKQSDYLRILDKLVNIHTLLKQCPKNWNTAILEKDMKVKTAGNLILITGTNILQREDE